MDRNQCIAHLKVPCFFIPPSLRNAPAILICNLCCTPWDCQVTVSEFILRHGGFQSAAEPFRHQFVVHQREQLWNDVGRIGLLTKILAENLAVINDLEIYCCCWWYEFCRRVSGRLINPNCGDRLFMDSTNLISGLNSGEVAGEQTWKTLHRLRSTSSSCSCRHTNRDHRGDIDKATNITLFRRWTHFPRWSFLPQLGQGTSTH